MELQEPTRNDKPLEARVEDDQKEDAIRAAIHSYVVDKDMERKMLWKIDTRILPLLSVMYLFK